jgi:predicted porin
MRKILLGTTGVVGAALIGMGAAQAQQAPTVRIGGFMSTTYNWVDDDADKAQGVPTGVAGQGRVARSKHDFRNEVEVHVFVTGKAANGLSYGAVIEIQNDNSGTGSGSGLDLDEAYGFVSSPTLGTLRFGEEDNAAAIMQVRVPTITGLGPDGDFDDGMLALANATGAASPSLLTGINDGNDATKIIYLSPQFFGFDFGASYAPTSNGEGERVWLGRQIDTLSVSGPAGLAVSNTQRDRTAGRNELGGALRYRGSFGNVGLAAGFGAMFADGAQSNAAGAPIGARNISAYTAGLNVTAFGFTVGGEYTWGNYSGPSVGRAGLAPGRDSSNHWVLGATYALGAVSFGGFYGVGKQDNGPGFGDREQTVWGLGVAYTLAPGLDLFANYNQLKDDNAVIVGGQALSRDADVIFMGARLAF